MSCSRELIPPCRKRHHSETGLSLDDLSKSQPSKRLRSEFYDSLSKVWLTRRALKELNRRTVQVNRLQRPVPSPQRLLPGETSPPEETFKQKRFARHGGPDLGDLRGYPALADVDPTPAMASSSSSRSRHTKSTVPTSASSKTRKSSAYDKDFEQHYIDHRVYPEGYDYRNRCPTPEPGLEGLDQRLSRPRSSLSPSRFPSSAFRDFKRTNARVISEGKVMSNVFPIISGNANIPNEENLQFTRLESITGSITVDPRPDFYDGARFEDIDREVREELGPYIIPTGHAMAPVAPNFFLEAKAPAGGADVAKRQAMQDGAYGARAMHSLQSYSKGKPVYDGNAYTITSTYHAGTSTLQLYTTHPTRGEDGISAEYHMTQVKAYALTSDADSFRQGATAFRNARDWAQEQRDTLITAANEKARSKNPQPTRTEGMTYSDWLTTLNDEPPVSDRLTPEHIYPAPSTTAQFDVNNPDVESEVGGLPPESLAFDLSPFNGPSDKCPVPEPETSASEPVLYSHAIPAAPSKRRHGGSERKGSKAPRYGHGKKKAYEMSKG